MAKEFRKIFFILLTTFVLVTLWANRMNIYPYNIYLWIEKEISCISWSEDFPCRISGDKIMTENIQLSDKCIIAISDSVFNVFSKKGKCLQSEKHGFSNPVLRSTNLRNIIFDKGGRNYKIVSSKNTISSMKTEQNILCADITCSGMYAIVTQSTRYLSELYFYDRNNNLKFKIPFSDYYVTNVSINSAVNEVAVAGISAYGGEINSNICLIDVTSQKIKENYLINNNMIFDVRYFDSGNVIVVGDKYAVMINQKSHKAENIDYEDKILKFFDFDPNGMLCLCLSSSESGASTDTILKVTNNLQKKIKIDTQYNFNDIISSKNKIICLENDKIVIYDSKGNVIKTVKLKHCYKKILRAKHNEVYAVYSCNIDKISI